MYIVSLSIFFISVLVNIFITLKIRSLTSNFQGRSISFYFSMSYNLTTASLLSFSCFFDHEDAEGEADEHHGDGNSHGTIQATVNHPRENSIDFIGHDVGKASEVGAATV